MDRIVIKCNCNAQTENIMKVKSLIKNFAYWTLPSGFDDLSRKLLFLFANYRSLKLCRKNIQYRNLHKGKRCFIVCNGPSINKQNLISLKNEIVFSVSSGYYHKDYSIYRPRYHCVPPVTYTEKFTKDITIPWFHEMHERIGDAELFLSHQEEPLVRENNLFPGRIVNYGCMNYGCMYEIPIRDIVDISRPMPGVQSVPILCIMIAIYMGFREIYLLGVEHDEFITGEYNYFFEQTLLAGKGGGVTKDGRILSLGNQLQANAKLWKQYRELKEVAVNHGISIYNATAGGALDEFERVSLENLWNSDPL